MNNQLSFIPLGGIGDVTKNMYVYEYGDQILLVDCGIGFADETMLGVDLLLPDVSYLLQTKKRIVGMVISHGHEDHFGALPFILPQLNQTFPIYGSPLTAAFANEKLKEFGLKQQVQTVSFADSTRKIGAFTTTFIHVTHSVPDTAHIFIETPAGNFYHGSDFKFDLTPFDGKRTEFAKIAKAQEKGILCLMSDSLGSERPGHTESEDTLIDVFEKEMKYCKGKFIVTTYSSNISRLNQIIQAAERMNRRICFLGKSLIKTKEIAQRLKYMHMRQGIELEPDQIKNYPDNQILLVVAGSQGQENSAMTRIANGEHKDVKLSVDDVVVFSADPIPGNEVSVYALIDTIAKVGARACYSDLGGHYHVSGHGSSADLLLLLSLTQPKKALPISGTFRHMTAYKNLTKKIGYREQDIILIDNGQEVIFANNQVRLGKKIAQRNIYVDAISGEEVESFVLRDRQKLSESGIIIIMTEIDATTGQLVGNPDIITRGFSSTDDNKIIQALSQELRSTLGSKKGRVTNWIYVRKHIGEVSERRTFKELRRRPLILPVVIEV